MVFRRTGGHWRLGRGGGRSELHLIDVATRAGAPDRLVGGIVADDTLSEVSLAYAPGRPPPRGRAWPRRLPYVGRAGRPALRCSSTPAADAWCGGAVTRPPWPDGGRRSMFGHDGALITLGPAGRDAGVERGGPAGSCAAIRSADALRSRPTVAGSRSRSTAPSSGDAERLRGAARPPQRPPPPNWPPTCPTSGSSAWPSRATARGSWRLVQGHPRLGRRLAARSSRATRRTEDIDAATSDIVLDRRGLVISTSGRWKPQGLGPRRRAAPRAPGSAGPRSENGCAGWTRARSIDPRGAVMAVTSLGDGTGRAGRPADQAARRASLPARDGPLGRSGAGVPVRGPPARDGRDRRDRDDLGRAVARGRAPAAVLRAGGGDGSLAATGR